MNERKIVAFKQSATKRKPKKKPKNFFFSFFLSAFILGVIYLATPLSRLSVIYFEGTNLLSRSDLVAQSGLRENMRIPFFQFGSIEASLAEHPLVDSASLSLSGLNRLVVRVREKDVMACAELDGALHYILENGQVLAGDGGVLPLCRGLVVYGLNEEALELNILGLFVSNLSQLDPLFISLINHIEHEPRWENVNRFSLSMRDGNTVIVDSHTMVQNLERYQTWVSALEDGVLGVFNFDVGNVFQPFSLEPESFRRDVSDSGTAVELSESVESAETFEGVDGLEPSASESADDSLGSDQ